MKARAFDPERLDVEAFAREAGHLRGEWPLNGMLRLAECAHADMALGAADRVAWHARGERRKGQGVELQPWLHLHLNARLALTCQRCLGPVETALAVDRRFCFVAGENQAAALDDQMEDDVLALTRALDLRALAEDELLLALPLVPRHEHCQLPLVAGAAEARSEEGAAPNPFAALGALRRPH